MEIPKPGKLERQGSNLRPLVHSPKLSYVPLCASSLKTVAVFAVTTHAQAPALLTASKSDLVNLSEVLRYAQFIWVRPSEIICRAVTPGKQGSCTRKAENCEYSPSASDYILSCFIGTRGDIFNFLKISLPPFLHILIRILLLALRKHSIHPVSYLRITQTVDEIQPKHDPQF